jgi:hypothetical protein
MTMMGKPSAIMLIFLSAALATPAAAQSDILSDHYQIMVPEKGSKLEQPEPWLAPKYQSLSLSQIKSVRIDGAVLQARVDLRCAHGTE